MTGTFDDWAKSIRLDRKKENLFEKVVQLPQTKENIYYKVGISTRFPSFCSMNSRFIFPRMHLSSLSATSVELLPAEHCQPARHSPSLTPLSIPILILWCPVDVPFTG